MSDSFYITTPIYYVNDVPHVGHAYTTIAADAFARFWRARGRDTYFLTGTDEHGQKIQEAAEARGVTPIELADSVVDRFKATWTKLDVANDDFIRTTEDRHKTVVREIWKRMEAAGDIYLGAFKGHYCVSCESFYPDNKLLPGKLCPIHEREVSWLEEPSYFFRMSKYQDKLLAHIEANPNFIRPQNYRNEVLSFVRGGLRDLSVSRTTFGWGIPVPKPSPDSATEADELDHIMFVWVDALSNYISALGEIGSEKSERLWPASCHLIGKDILRFHAVYWPTMLMSAGLPLPESILAHGWWTLRGKKISKTLPATRVDPNMIADDIGADALRYFLLREVPLGLDGDFSYESLLGRYNSELANDLGNLGGRSTAMTHKYRDGAVPPYSAAMAAEGPSVALVAQVLETIKTATAEFEDYAPSRALDSIWALVREGNRYIGVCEPWKMAKDPSLAGSLDHVLRSAFEVLATVAQLIAPVMPSKAVELLTRLGLSAEESQKRASTWPTAEAFGSLLDGAGMVEKGGLFPRIEPPEAVALLDKWIPDDAKIDGADGADGAAGASESKKTSNAKAAKKSSEKNAKPTDGLVSFKDFQRFEFRIAKVIAAEPVAKTKKLLQVRLDVGELGERQVIAGIAEAYRAETLVGKSVIFLANLEPATIRGVRSEGMILAAGDKTIVGLSTIDSDAAPGTIVR